MVSRREVALKNAAVEGGNGVVPVTMYQTTDGALYMAQSDADTAQRKLDVKGAVAKVVDRFFYQDMSRADIVQGLMDNFADLSAAFKGVDQA
jgi:hypothetical protein